MTHVITYFEHIPMPDAMQEDDLSTGQVEPSLRDSIGGVFDYFGNDQCLPRKQQFPHRGKYVGEVHTRITSDGDTRVTDSGDSRITAAARAADLRGKVDDLKGMVGTTGALWRERVADSVLSWKRCRLLKVGHVETVETANVVSEVESIFETSDAGWRSEEATVTEASATAGIVAMLVVPNSGAVLVHDAIITVECTSGTITHVAIGGSGIALTWTGSLAVGQVLVIDSGEKTVLKEGANAYSGFTYGVGHTTEDPLPLLRGDNIISVTLTGGNGDVTVEHYNQWP